MISCCVCQKQKSFSSIHAPHFSSGISAAIYRYVNIWWSLIVRKSGVSRFEPRASGWEEETLPLCHVVPKAVFIWVQCSDTKYEKFYKIFLYDKIGCDLFSETSRWPTPRPLGCRASPASDFSSEDSFPASSSGSSDAKDHPSSVSADRTSSDTPSSDSPRPRSTFTPEDSSAESVRYRSVADAINNFGG